MFTTREIWEAGRTALGIKANAPEVAPDTFTATAAADQKSELPAVFDPAQFTFEARAYRIHFKNGLSGEYDGAALVNHFPFDPREVQSVDTVDELNA